MNLNAFSPVDRAIADLIAMPPAEEGEELRLLLTETKKAVDARNGYQDSIFMGFLALAAQVRSESIVRQTGARLRKLVADRMKTTARAEIAPLLPINQVQEWDYSTASVYAKIVGEMLTASQRTPEAWSQAMADAAQRKSRRSTNAIHKDSGFFMSLALCRRALARYSEMSAT